MGTRRLVGSRPMLGALAVLVLVVVGLGATRATAPAAAAPGPGWASISAGLAHTCGLTEAGVAYCWGSDGSGRLGDGPTLTGSRPRPRRSPPPTA